jgi:multidrug resistance protein MdtO
MATLASSPVAALSRPGWFWQFLRDEFEPYPERVQLAGRMVLTSTLVMLICEAYRVPYAFQGPVLALFISRESTRASVNSVLTMALGLIGGTIFVIASAPFFLINPILHYVWVGLALFVVFFALPTVNNYIGVLMFSVLITVGLPLWDRAVSAKVNVEDTLWLLWVSVLGVAVALAVELAFAPMRPDDNVIQPIRRRLDAVEAVLRCLADGHPLDHNATRQIQRYAMLGTSLARRNAQRSGLNLPYVARAQGVISLVGTLVDTTAGLTELEVRPSDDERRRARELAGSISHLRREFLARQTPALIHFADAEKAAPGLPLLRSLEETVELIPKVFAEPPALKEEAQPVAPTPAPLFAHDAFTNTYYLQFAVKGTLAALFCYMFYTSINWPGISTSVVTCTFTALTTIGSSRQKQVLRFLGAAIGGFVFGMGAQIFLLPYIDTIFGFTILYVIVTAISVWIMTASPRISYCGVQIALAFYLVHLQAFKFETSLSIARDRVVGVMVGLLAMWIIFDQLWGHPAVADMRRTFVANVCLLARLARKPDTGDRGEVLRRLYSLGQTINNNFDQVRNLGDVVIFEFGASRAADLADRDRFRQWQGRLRALFLIRGAMLRYALGFPGFELPKDMLAAQATFDEEIAGALDGMADRLSGGTEPRTNHLPEALQRLESVAEFAPPELARHMSDFMALCRTAEQLTLSVAEDVQKSAPLG